ncbi:MAG: phosphatidate cytidylyltransferase [Actinomycetota bacterium]|jgi:phosphatidate cytidylyltransferase|nr:phosphatidate cytidylyltransferase [Actinomycetota bacterium]
MSSVTRAPGGLSSLGGRLGTAAVYGSVMLSVIIFAGTLGLAIVMSIAAVLAVIEFYAITRREHRLPNEVFGVVAVACMPIATALWGQLGLSTVLAASIVLSLIWHVAFAQVRASDTAVTLFGAVYTGYALSHLVLIRALDSGTELALAVVISVWANDVFAYLVGSTVGRHRMSPNISPNKSWEGFASGTLFTMATWGAVYGIVGAAGGEPVLSLGWHLILGLAVAMAAVIGDLAESRLKREAGVKDSGTLLPGHGGFLDRFDSLILVSIVAFYLLEWGSTL